MSLPTPASTSTSVPTSSPSQLDTAARGPGSILPASVQHMPTRGSHIFVCPAPLPSLPHSLPQLASYLQSLVAHSRSGQAGDNSNPNGLKRLSKLVDKHYPNDGGYGSIMEPDQAKKLAGLFSKVMPKPRRGEGSRWRAIRSGGWKGGGADLNEEAYDLVTPFRLDS